MPMLFTNDINDKQGVLLVNLGTPLSPSVKHVRSYLTEFLMDERVIDVNPVLRNILVKGLIVPFRSKNSASLYRHIWTKDGSPLLYYSKQQRRLLQKSLGDGYQVELAMRYQNPSIQNALNKLKASGLFRFFRSMHRPVRAPFSKR
jgi:ferrochelatase